MPALLMRDCCSPGPLSPSLSVSKDTLPNVTGLHVSPCCQAWRSLPCSLLDGRLLSGMEDTLIALSPPQIVQKGLHTCQLHEMIQQTSNASPHLAARPRCGAIMI